VSDEALAQGIARTFDARPAAIIAQLDLRRPIYRTTSAYGHFGRDGFAWEALDRVDALRRAVGV
jgi:S-adenosylmethionine synthetase